MGFSCFYRFHYFHYLLPPKVLTRVRIPALPLVSKIFFIALVSLKSLPYCFELLEMLKNSFFKIEKLKFSQIFPIMVNFSLVILPISLIGFAMHSIKLGVETLILLTNYSNLAFFQKSKFKLQFYLLILFNDILPIKKISPSN